jgi:hypothetical protein
VLDYLGTAHADPVVGHGDRARVLVVADPDLQRALVGRVLGGGQHFQPQPVDGVRRVRDQLTQENVLVAVQRVDHEVQDLDHFGLETEAFLLRLRAHGISLGSREL